MSSVYKKNKRIRLVFWRGLYYGIFNGQQEETASIDYKESGTVAVGRVDAGVGQTLVRQTRCGDGDHGCGQRLSGLRAAQPLVTL